MKLCLLLHIFQLVSSVYSTSVATVVGESNGVVILPCSFSPGHGEAIHWTIGSSRGTKVHIYYEGKDQLDNQDKDYNGRTSLLSDHIKEGNASLQLRNLQKSDANKYICTAGTTEKYEESTVILKVEGAVWGEQHKNVTIPCSFKPGEDVVIHWSITSNDSRIVHRYSQGQDMLETQDKSYKGRTSLFPSELAEGNASLLIRDLQEGDTNTYSCYVGTNTENNEDEVKLYVADFGHLMEYGEDHLKCYSRHVAHDTVTIAWYEGDHEKQQENSTSSSCTFCDLSNNTYPYKCIIRHSVVQTTWTGTWQRKAIQDNIKCACTLCKTGSAKMSVRLYLRKNTTEVPVASINSSTLFISDGYKSRTHGNLAEYSLQLNNLTANDNGDYICEIITTNEMCTTLISANITDIKEKDHRNHLMILLPLVFCLFVFGILYLFIRCKAPQQ